MHCPAAEEQFQPSAARPDFCAVCMEAFLISCHLGIKQVGHQQKMFTYGYVTVIITRSMYLAGCFFLSTITLKYISYVFCFCFFNQCGYTTCYRDQWAEIRPLEQWISMVRTASPKAVKIATYLVCQKNQWLLLGFACMWLAAIDVVFCLLRHAEGAGG